MMHGTMNLKFICISPSGETTEGEFCRLVTTAERGEMEIYFMCTVIHETLAAEKNKCCKILGFCCGVEEVFGSSGMLQTANQCHTTSQNSRYCNTYET
jgi:hypothetical protein